MDRLLIVRAKKHKAGEKVSIVTDWDVISTHYNFEATKPYTCKIQCTLCI